MEDHCLSFLEKSLLAAPQEEYMSPQQVAFFRARLEDERRQLLERTQCMLEQMRSIVASPDPSDQASMEEKCSLEFRMRERECKLLKKIQYALQCTENGTYGWCQETGEPIGIPRLLARPAATPALKPKNAMNCMSAPVGCRAKGIEKMRRNAMTAEAMESLFPISARAADMYAYTTPEPAGLVQIFHPFTQIAIWQRDVDTVIDDYIRKGLIGSCSPSGFRTVMRPGKSLASDFLPRLSGREEMIEDVRFIAELYWDLLDCDEIALRLEVVNGAMCPRFHVDRTGIRLICTYHGRGTEWINDEGIDRSKLGPGLMGLADEASGLLDEKAEVGSVGPFDVALLKGSLWQGNAQRGVIHRSPAVGTDDFRILLVMDAIWTSDHVYHENAVSSCREPG